MTLVAFISAFNSALENKKVGPDPISPDDKDEYFPYPNAPPFPKFPLAVPLHDGIHFHAR